MKPKSLQNSVSKRGAVVESFFGQPSNQLASHFWSLGLSIGARKSLFNKQLAIHASTWLLHVSVGGYR